MRKSLSVLTLLAATGPWLSGADMRLGIIGTDTSHVVAFTRVLNDPANPDHIPGFRVVAAVKGGSMDIPSSKSRVEEYAASFGINGKWRS